MSRFTSSLFNKPPSFEFPRHGMPPSPPETHSETITGLPHVLSAPSFGVQDSFPIDAAPASASPDHFGARPKKSSSIPYHSSPVARESQRPTGSRNKTLLLVLPPPTLLQEPGTPSQDISRTPFHRLAHGVLLPLLPSLFSQLTVIAKEFNFPSTAGLVLYYQFAQDGVSFTPRISEDSWQSIWANLSDPQERPPLIGGKIEFDIDLRLAKWFTAWLSALRREVVDYTSTYHPSSAPSMAHLRGGSRTTMADQTLNEDDSTEVHQPTRSRHVPRKLSLVEKLDISAARSINSPPVTNSNPGKSRPLSTIAQEEEPKSAPNDLVDRVKNWRASAVLAPSAIAASGQPSLDPANLPNDMEVPAPLDDEEEELRMSDFAWSISSAGPPSPAEESVSTWSYVPSVHITQRMAGSVASTASYHTESGPSDYDPLSPISWSYPPSIHLANRLEGSVCSTISYQTSFGPSIGDPYSPLVASSHLPTPDIAGRFFEDSPPTPQTATSWGAPSWPASPRCYSPTPSLDLGDRAMYDAASAPRREYPREAPETEGDGEKRPWKHVWPYFNANGQGGERPWKHSWPYFKPDEQKAPEPWKHSWPYFKPEEDPAPSSWPHVWPYHGSRRSDDSSLSISDDKPQKPWGHAWPYREYEKEVVPETNPEAKPWEHTWPYRSYNVANIADSLTTSPEPKNTTKGSLSVRAPVSYPAFDLYPAVYPYNLSQIYPDIQTSVEHVDHEGYPYFDLYPTKTGPKNAYLMLSISNPRGQYPHFEIYPDVGKVGLTTLSQTSLSPAPSSYYPSLVIYAPVYPHFDLYPAPAAVLSTASAVTEGSHVPDHFELVTKGYPAFNLYPAVYPDFDIYPVPYYEAIEARATQNVKADLSVVSTAGYPLFNLYPAVYPNFDLYSAPYYEAIEARATQNVKADQSVVSTAGYPSFNLYPAVYPNFDLSPAPYYEAIEARAARGVTKGQPDLSVVSTTGYPSFNLYPPVYPHFDLYPAPYFSKPPTEEQSRSSDTASITLSQYPIINLYPAIYPNFDLYPTVLAEVKPPTASPRRQRPTSRLPVPIRVSTPSTPPRRPKSSRLTHSELHAMVMMDKVGATLTPMVPRRALSASQHTPQRSFSNDVFGLPSSPASGLRRQTSLADRKMSYMQNIAESSSLGPGPSPLSRRPSQQRQSLHGARRRDSLVLQKARVFDSADHSTHSPSSSRESISKLSLPSRSFPPLNTLPSVVVDREAR